MTSYIKGLLFLSISFVAFGEQSTPVSFYKHEGEQFPPVFFVSNIEDKAFAEKLKSFGAFTEINETAVGYPIGLRVLKGHRTKQDGTQFSSMLLSASTLGIIPVVQNTEFKVHYELFVQGKLISTFKYQLDSTDVDNFWTAAYKTHKVTPTEEQFIVDTLPQFLTELSQDEKAAATFKEYWTYFPKK